MLIRAADLHIDFVGHCSYCATQEALQTVATADRAVKIHSPDSTSSLLLFVSMSDTDRLLTGPGSALSVQSMVAEICSQGTVTDGCELQDRATHTVRA